MIDLLPDGVLACGPDGRLVAINQVARQMLGGGAIGDPIDVVLCLQDQEGRSWMDYNRPFAGIGIRRGVPEQSWLLRDGSEVLVTAHIQRAGPAAPITGLGLVLRSGRGRARLDRERSDLVATVAHELRSPLTGVKGFVQAMLNRWEKLSNDQKRLMLTTVNADADRLARLIAELLDVARIDTGRLSLYPRPSRVDELLERVVDSARAATSRPIVLDCDDAPAEFVLDPDKFTQVMANLIENAVRHGSGEIRVLARRTDAGLRVVVEDDGDGIAPEIRRRIFTKFWKYGEHGGSGLGLYIVGGLVKAHQGTVSVESAASGGARMVVDLPASSEAATGWRLDGATS